MACGRVLNSWLEAETLSEAWDLFQYYCYCYYDYYYHYYYCFENECMVWNGHTHKLTDAAVFLFSLPNAPSYL